MTYLHTIQNEYSTGLPMFTWKVQDAHSNALKKLLLEYPHTSIKQINFGMSSYEYQRNLLNFYKCF